MSASSLALFLVWLRTMVRSGLRHASLATVMLLVAVLGSVNAVAATANWVPGPAGSTSPGGLTVPTNGVILTGSGVNPATSLPYRHLWLADHLQGFCRVDPDIDSAETRHSLNAATCLPGAVPQGPAVFDPVTKNVYVADGGAKGTGVSRLHFLPGGDGGKGLMDTGIPPEQVGAASNGCGLPGNRTTAIALGSDGNLYVGTQKNGNIVRIVSPGNVNVPCASFQAIGSTPDGRRTVGLAWAGRSLFGIDGNGPFQLSSDSTVCSAAQPCRGQSILGTTIPGALSIASDGSSTLFFGDTASVAKVQVAGLVTTLNWGTSVQFPTGLTVDNANPGNPVLYAADDPTNGAGTLQGRIFRMRDAVVAAAPGAPTGVNAVPADGAATVNWTPGTAGSTPTSFYTVRTIGGSVAPQSTQPGATGNSLLVGGLTNGVAYSFTVEATNSVGTSPASGQSIAVTPTPATAPAAPTNVTASVGDASAAVTWTPGANGGSPITGYTVVDAADPTIVRAQAGATSTGATVTNLVNGNSYAFKVRATNAKGSTDSAASNSVTPAGAPAATPTLDVAVAMAGPTQVPSGTNAVYTMTVTNTGNVTVQQVELTDRLPASGYTQATVGTPSRGACVGTADPLTFLCNFGAMTPGASESVTVTLSGISATVTNNASVTPKDANGTPLTTDATPPDNTSSITTTLAPPPPAPTTTTDLQVGGSASTGSPSADSVLTYTWQVRNGGKQAAGGVTFTITLANSVTLQPFTPPAGMTCSIPNAGTAGGSVICSRATLGSGQSFNVNVNVRVGVAVPVGTPISSTGTIQADPAQTIDSNTRNDSATVTVTTR